MSDRDPMDMTYREAEAILDDEAARAARRARVLAAVATDPTAPVPVSEPSKRRPVWVQGGWLAAACAAGLSLVVVLRANPPAVNAPPPPAARPEAPATPAPAAPDAGPAAPAAQAPPSAAEPRPAPAARVVAPQAPAAAPVAEVSPRDVTAVPTAPSPSPLQVAPSAPPPAASPPPPAPPPPPPPAAAADGVQGVVVTGSRVAKPAGAAARDEAAGRVALAAPAAPAAQAVRLRAAAAAGRTAELSALLDAGAPIDAVDAEDETALMKAVKARRPAAVALLHGRGANLELKNRKGLSAREMAAAIGDPELNRALGIAP